MLPPRSNSDLSSPHQLIHKWPCSHMRVIPWFINMDFSGCVLISNCIQLVVTEPWLQYFFLISWFIFLCKIGGYVFQSCYVSSTNLVRNQASISSFSTTILACLLLSRLCDGFPAITFIFQEGKGYNKEFSHPSLSPLKSCFGNLIQWLSFVSH